MIKLVSAVGFATLMLSPAMAAPAARHHHAHAGYAQTTPGYAENDMGSTSADNPVVVVAGKYIGRDPDADVRLDLRREAGNEVD